MILADIPSGTTVFVDANVFVYAFAPDPQFGPPAAHLLERIEHGDVLGFATTHVLSDTAHRLMCLEACATFQWSFAGIARQLKRHPGQMQQLSRFRQAIDAIIAIGVQIVPTAAVDVSMATAVSQQDGLLSGDALIVSLMRRNGITHLAGNDADFDRVAKIIRVAPV